VDNYKSSKFKVQNSKLYYILKLPTAILFLKFRCASKLGWILVEAVYKSPVSFWQHRLDVVATLVVASSLAGTSPATTKTAAFCKPL